MENKIEFINKVYMGKEAKSGKKVFSVIAGVLFAIVLIGSFLIAGGVGGISVSVLGLVVYNLSNTGGKKTSTDRKSTRLNSSHTDSSRMPSSA